MITINLTELTEEQLIAIMDIALDNSKAISRRDYDRVLDQLEALIGTEDARTELQRLQFEKSLFTRSN